MYEVLNLLIHLGTYLYMKTSWILNFYSAANILFIKNDIGTTRKNFDHGNLAT